MIICTMTTSSHLYRAKVMARSAKQHHPHAKVIVCLVEKNTHKDAKQVPYFDEVVLAKNLGIPDFNRYLFKRTIQEASYSLKGHFLQYLFRAFPKEQQIVMLDTDMMVLGHFEEMDEALANHSIVLTPHVVDNVLESGQFRGIFNIGFIALKRSEDTNQFLNWWTNRVDQYGFEEFQSRGLFFEQTWLDLAPNYFNVNVLHHPGYNVAFWNLHERGASIHRNLEGEYTVSGLPLRCFHFSNLTSYLVQFMKRFVPPQNGAIYRLVKRYNVRLRKMGQKRSLRYNWSYESYTNGKKIRKEMRARYRNAPELEKKYPDPYTKVNKTMPPKSGLRIVQVVSNIPDAYPLPPKNQGGTEKVVYDLTEELVKKGNEVYLYAAEGSRSSAKLTTYPLTLKEGEIGRFVARTLPPNVDIIHDHTFNSTVQRIHINVPTVSTHHIPRNNNVANSIYVSKRALAVIGKNKGYYVYNGINPNEYEFSEQKQDYLLFMGRIIREKGVIKAIEVAEKTKKKLIIAGPIKDFTYYRNVLEPRIRLNPNIKYIGAVGGKQKQDLLKHAHCLLFPSLWEEPFGLTMVEAMMCGTPVLAFNNGAVSEVLAGFPQLICQTADEMANLVKKNIWPSPQSLRSYVLGRFTSNKMAEGYLEIYQKLIGKKLDKQVRPLKKRVIKPKLKKKPT